MANWQLSVIYFRTVSISFVEQYNKFTLQNQLHITIDILKKKYPK
jgi:hypothetical protein